MTELKAEAISLIEKMPENEMPRVLKEIQNLYERYRPRTPEEKELEKQRAMAAWENLQKFVKENRLRPRGQFDYKKEIEEIREERRRRYENLNVLY